MLTYHIDLEPDPRDGSVTATIREFPGCIAEGDDREKALLSLLAVAPCWIDAAHASEFPIPEPEEGDDPRLRDALEATRDRLSLECGASPLICHTYAAALSLVINDGMTLDAAMRRVTG